MKKLLLSLLCIVALVTARAENPVADVGVGKRVEFTVTVEGTLPFTYKWQKAPPGQDGNSDFVDIVGAPDANVYVIPVVAAGDAGVYRVIVTNAYGVATSDHGTLNIGAGPRIVNFGITVSTPPNP